MQIWPDLRLAILRFLVLAGPTRANEETWFLAICVTRPHNAVENCHINQSYLYKCPWYPNRPPPVVDNMLIRLGFGPPDFVFAFVWSLCQSLKTCFGIWLVAISEVPTKPPKQNRGTLPANDWQSCHWSPVGKRIFLALSTLCGIQNVAIRIPFEHSQVLNGVRGSRA